MRDASVHIGGCVITTTDDAVLLRDGETVIRFDYAKHGGGANAMKLALRDAEERAMIRAEREART